MGLLFKHLCHSLNNWLIKSVILFLTFTLRTSHRLSNVSNCSFKKSIEKRRKKLLRGCVIFLLRGCSYFQPRAERSWSLMPPPGSQLDIQGSLSLGHLVLVHYGSPPVEIGQACSCLDQDPCQLGTPVAKWCCIVVLEMNRVASRAVGPTADRCRIANKMGLQVIT